MGDPVFWHRLQFGFTASFHYIFPQLTMGLALLIAVFKYLGLRTGEAVYNDAARFWIRVFGINFAVGVVTGIPLEFQFGTNWSRFSLATGNFLGQLLSVEAMSGFMLESIFLYLMVTGWKRLSPGLHLVRVAMVTLGATTSSFCTLAP